MKTFFCQTVWLLIAFISIEICAEEQKIYEVDTNRETTRSESIVPTFYQEYGPYLFFLSQPEYDPQCCSVLRAYSSDTLWRLDPRDNSVQLVVSGLSGRKKATSYGIVNDRIIYFSTATDSLISTDLSGLDKRSLGTINGRYNNEPYQMVRHNGYVYFTVDGEQYGAVELWRSDGSAEGTTKVNLCIESTCYEKPRKLIVSDNKLFFITTSDDNTNVIWSVNSDNELVVFSEATVSSQENLFPVSSGVQFNSTNQLWFTDGTSAGSYPINFIKNNTLSKAIESIDFGDLVVIASEEIYVISDKGKGVTTLIDVDPRVEGGNEYSSIPSNLTILNNFVYFIGKFYDPALGVFIPKLMSTDGTPEGIHDIFEFPLLDHDEYKIVATKGNKLIIFRHVPESRNNISEINEMWISDGTTEGTMKLTEHGVPNNLWELDTWHFLQNDFYFSGYSEEHGIELWRTDGSVSGTLLAKDIGYGQTKVQKGPIATNGDDVFYMMQRKWYGEVDSILGEHTERELWKTDVLTMRSSKVTQWNSPKKTLKQIITVEGGQYWWVEGKDLSHSDLVFYDDQSEDVTTVITDMWDQCVDSDFTRRKMATLGKNYFFQAPVINNDSWSCQLWVSDGTVDGTKAVTSLPRTAIHREIINNIVTYQNEVYFSLLVQVDEYLPLRTAIFKTNGTVSGTGEVFRLSASGEDSLFYIENMLATSQGIYLVTDYGSTNLWYWQPTGITQVVDNADDFSIWSLTRFKEGISFVNNNAIWSSDGTKNGTLPMIALEKIEGKHNYVHNLYSTPDYEKLIYGSLDSEGNNRLWVSDGTLFGTKAKGPIINDNNFIVNAFSGNDFYVTDYSGIYGEEFYQDFKRVSLEGDIVELIMQRRADDANFPITVVEAQGRIFIGQESEIISYYGPGFGGPYVTAKLNNEDFDNDGFMDNEDMFPLHYDEHQDTDKDNIGNNFDTDDDNDGIADELDLFPLDATEWADNDTDGLGDTSDLDDDNDGVSDWFDSYPKDPSRSTNDTDGDGIGNNADTDDDGDGVPDSDDAYPLDPTKSTAPTETEPTKSSGGGSTSLYMLLILLLAIVPRGFVKANT
ncbi:thrombospondin type 3 repeat-containing protein [Thalassotalea piscium]